MNLIRQNLDDIEKATKNLQLIYRTVNDSSQPSESIIDANVRGAMSMFLYVTNAFSAARTSGRCSPDCALPGHENKNTDSRYMQYF